MMPAKQYYEVPVTIKMRVLVEARGTDAAWEKANDAGYNVKSDELGEVDDIDIEVGSPELSEMYDPYDEAI